MSTSTLPQILRGPHKLPHLLSILPQSGKNAVVRPVNAPEKVLYLVTKSKLRFTSVIPKPPPSSSSTASSSTSTAGASKAAGGKVAEIQAAKPQLVPSNPVDGGTVRAHGKAWGMKFYGDHYQPLSKTKSATPEIRQGKTAWVALDPSTLSETARQAIKDVERIQTEHEARRSAVLEARAELWEDRRGEKREERKAMLAKLRERREEAVKVKIVY